MMVVVDGMPWEAPPSIGVSLEELPEQEACSHYDAQAYFLRLVETENMAVAVSCDAANHDPGEGLDC